MIVPAAGANPGFTICYSNGSPFIPESSLIHALFDNYREKTMLFNLNKTHISHPLTNTRNPLTMDPEPCSVLEMLLRAIHMLKSYKKEVNKFSIVMHAQLNNRIQHITFTTNVTCRMDAIKTFTELTNRQRVLTPGAANSTLSNVIISHHRSDKQHLKHKL